MALLCTATFVVIGDGAVVFVALPSIQQDLGLSVEGVQWFLNAYLLTFGGLLLLGGRAADLLGRRRVFLVGIGLITLSSLFCGLAWSAEIVIAARAAQGVSAAILTPTALSILMTIFREGPERNKALGIWSAVGGLGGTAGALLGGPLTDGLGWEWTFFVIVPIGLGMFALTPVLLRESFDRARARTYDFGGAITITAALAALVYAMVKAPEVGWTNAQTLGLLAASAVLFALFVLIESRSAAPLVPLRIFRSRAVVGGNLVMLAIGMGVYGAMGFVITTYAQGVLGYSAVQFGFMLTVGTVLSIVGSIAAGSLVTRFGVRSVAAAGMILMAAGCLVLTQISANGSYFDDIFLGMLLFGLGLGFGFVAASVAALSGIDDADAGLASGCNNVAFNIGGALGIAILATVAISQTSGADPRTAMTEGFQAAYGVAVVIAIVGILVAFLFLGRPRRTKSESMDHVSAVPAPVPIQD